VLSPPNQSTGGASDVPCAATTRSADDVKGLRSILDPQALDMRAAHEDGTFVAPICAAASAWLAVASHSCALTG
jgi:hypothetical protein